MTIELEVEGVLYERFVSAEVSMSMDNIQRSFTFGAASADGNPLPFKGGESCRCIIDDEVMLTGFIEVININTKSEMHDIRISGRSITGNVVDSSLDALDISLPISLKKVIETVLAFLENDISVIDEVGDLEDFNTAEDKVGPSVGENAFEFIERLARKRQVLLTCDGDSNIVITRASPEEIDISLQNILKNNTNNIISSRVKYDHTNRFRNYSVRSQLNPSAIDFGENVALSDVVNQSGTATDEAVRNGRTMVLKAEKSSSTEQCAERATWEANMRRARSSVYFAKVGTHSTSVGNAWPLNKLVQINDVFANINGRMLLNSVKFMMDLDEGNITHLGFVTKDSYLVEISEPEATTDNVGEDIF